MFIEITKENKRPIINKPWTKPEKADDKKFFRSILAQWLSAKKIIVLTILTTIALW